ncbi:hypothetical protein EGJ52_08665 [Pseudomonas luteola]|uniref:hypothetical protein n=1 Tax=Pseudomonas luteola TaxID=47886 RepID=UPI000F770B0A|nr:hypothetical protein [Pseudomonas luteola]RRW45082.1 hypothetical protein EGJ52_08665 [Pseudomonas luteola]
MKIQTNTFKVDEEELNALIADKLSDYESNDYNHNKVVIPLYKLSEYLESGYTLIKARPSYLNRGSVLMLKPTELQEVEKVQLISDTTAAYNSAIASNWASLEQTVLEGVKDKMLELKGDQLRAKAAAELASYEEQLNKNFTATMTYINNNLNTILTQIQKGAIK